MAIESYEHVDYAGLKNEALRNNDPPIVRGSPLLVYIMISRDPLYDSTKKLLYC